MVQAATVAVAILRDWTTLSWGFFQSGVCARREILRVVFPLTEIAREASGGGNPRKMGIPGPTPEIRENLPQKRGKNTPKNAMSLMISEGPKGGRRKGGRGRKLSHFSFCCACVVYSPCFPVWGEEKVMTIYDAGPLAAGPLCGPLMILG